MNKLQSELPFVKITSYPSNNIAHANMFSQTINFSPEALKYFDLDCLRFMLHHENTHLRRWYVFIGTAWSAK
jgi:hypothetical protein